ncbi:hypothetical protein E2C01_060419 [Portunus trituberculatus]|uniref:Uncharacterized protein n=1 Tax=Portunus trituberculatus TaxID=210409 RepID=A0A5B7H571_PORTR|nr:hypothetical protein [Portunus trituberculatus]
MDGRMDYGLGAATIGEKASFPQVPKNIMGRGQARWFEGLRHRYLYRDTGRCSGVVSPSG